MKRAGRKLATEQLGLGVVCGGPDRERLKRYNAWFTPQGVALQVCRFLARLIALGIIREPGVILDNQAGGGVFGWAMRQVWPVAHRIAIEIRAEEYECLVHNYDSVEIIDYLADVAELAQGLAVHKAIRPWVMPLPPQKRGVDAIITNPSFEDALAVADRSLHDLAPEGWLALLVRLTWGDNADVAKWLREHPPVAGLELDGRIEFAVGINPETGKPYAQDSTTYRVLVWREGGGRLIDGAIDYERYLKLPRLTDEQRMWMRVAGKAVRPGTEYLHPSIDDEIQRLRL